MHERKSLTVVDDNLETPKGKGCLSVMRALFAGTAGSQTAPCSLLAGQHRVC